MPMPRLADVVHAVTATFGSRGWTLRAPGGQQVVVDRLADAHAAARRLVSATLGIPAATVRIRITPDRATLVPLRRS